MIVFFEESLQVVVQDAIVPFHKVRCSYFQLFPVVSGARSLKEDRNLFFAAQKLFGLLITLGEANLTRPGMIGMVKPLNRVQSLSCISFD